MKKFLLLKEINNDDKIKKIILDNYNNSEAFVNAIPNDFKKIHSKNAKTLGRILEKPDSDRKQIATSSIEELLKQIVTDEKERRDIFINQLIEDNKYLHRPLANLDITVCNILGSKGLGADVVFLIGFDQGKLPFKDEAEDGEIYQILVALTRASKCMYFVNTIGSKISSFIDCIDSNLIEKI